MNRRTMIGGMMAAPAALRAQGVDGWAAWWERSNRMVHTAHTRGYSDMYLRNKGIKPPTYQV